MNRLYRSLLTLILVFTASTVSANGLLDALTGQLGVTTEQASGGAGSLFNLAKNNLSDSDYSQIASVVPGIEEMISSVPASGDSGSVAAVASMLGGDSSTGNLASLVSSFGDLGMNSDMVGKFMPIILDYLQSEGGQTVMELMKGALSL